MSAVAELINSLATLVGAVAWPIAVFAIIALLRKEIVDLIGRVENFDLGGNSIKFREAAITAVADATEQLAESQEVEAAPGVVAPIDDRTLELIEDNPREAVLAQWDRVQRALIGLSDRHSLEIDLRSMRHTATVLKDADLVSDELASALRELHKTCKYARRVSEFDLPVETVEGYVRATNDAIKALKNA